jgi:large subunit ribosomal protein L6
MPIPTGLKVEVDEKKKNIIHLSWIDKQLLWEYTAKIRSLKKPEPYKGKWIRYVGEFVRRKAGKSGKKK